MKKIAFVLKGYPRLSETFIAKEILALENFGLQIEIVSLRHPTDPTVHPMHRKISANVRYLPEYLHHETLRVIAAWWACRKKAGYKYSVKLFVKDLKRDFSRNRVRRFGQALVMAHELGEDFVHLHAHFIHTPASVVRYASVIRGLPFSISAHAKDIWTSSEWDLEEKLSAADFTFTCTKNNVQYLRSLISDNENILLAYHGLDLSVFSQNMGCGKEKSIAKEKKVVKLLAVGRTVKKKGFDILLHALANLSDNDSWSLTHIGGGELTEDLAKLASSLSIDENVTWLGALPQDEVLHYYRTHDIIILPSIQTEDGDMDGLPNVLMEAMSQGMVCISTRLSGIPELITHDENGILVESGNIVQLSMAIRQTIDNRDLREQLSKNGVDTIHKKFDMMKTMQPLYKKFSFLKN